MEEERRVMDSPSRSPPQAAGRLRLHSSGKVRRVECVAEPLPRGRVCHATVLRLGEENSREERRGGPWPQQSLGDLLSV